MAFIIKDRVKEGTTSTGTGAVSLGGAAATFDPFNSYMVNGDTTYYAIVHTTSGTDEWEVGLGTWNTGNTLTRTTILSGSNGTSAVDFSAGTKNVFMTYPASHAALAYDDVTFDNISVTGTVDGRDVAADGAKLDTVETNADVTDVVNVAAAGALMKSGGTMTGDLILNGDPTVALGAATKEYVDTIAAAGIHYHTPVRVETPSALTATYDNGASGVGATLTNSGTQAALTIDGVTVALNDRVLVYKQTNAAHNGIYTVTDTGSASTNWVLTRAVDADSYGASDPDAMGEGDAYFVKEGDTGAGELYVMNTSGVITFGTTPITFTVIAETAVYSAGTGISLDGTTFSIGQDVATTANVTFNQVVATIIGNVTGNLTGNVTGNADTATALETARTIQLTGDVIGSATFDGTANAVITASVQDDSHAHVISNVDGLQAALDAKADDTTTISAGTGLTGGGSIGVNRTISLDTSYTDGRYVNVTGDTMTGDLVLEDSELHVGDKSADNWTRIKHALADGYGFDWQHDNATVIVNEQGSTNQALVLGDVDAADYTGLFGIAHSTDSGSSWAKKLDLRGNGELYIGSSGSSRVFHDGYHPNADKWTTARTLSLSGDASGSVSWDGSANATLSVTVNNDSHNHNHSDGNFTVNGDLYGKSVNGAYSSIYRMGGIYFTWDSDSYGDNIHHSIRSTNGNTYGDSITINSYGNIRMNIDSNNNGSNTFSIGHATTGTDSTLFSMDESGNVEIAGTLEVLGNRIGFVNNSFDAEIRVDDGNPDGTGAVFEFWGDAVQGNAQVKAESFRASNTVFVGSQIQLNESADRADLLEISSSTTGWAGLQIRNTSNEGRWSFMTDGEQAGIYNDEDNQWAILFNETGDQLYYRAGAEKLRLTSNGVKITSPYGYGDFGPSNTSWFHMNTDRPSFYMNKGLRAAGTIGVYNQNTYLSSDDLYLNGQIFHYGDTNTYMQFHASDQWRVVTGGTERLEVNNTNTTVANTLIAKNATFDNGTSTTVNIKCDDAGNARLNICGDSQGTGILFVGQSTTYGGGIEYNGDNTPAFSGAGSDQIALYRVSNGTVSWTAKNAAINNDWLFRGNVTAYASDKRLKKNIKPISNAVEKVTQLEGVTYDWIDECEELGFLPSMKTETGVIAQDVQKVIPDAVMEAPFNSTSTEITGEERNYLTVDKEKIIPLLIEAIKEQQTQIDELKAKLEA